MHTRKELWKVQITVEPDIEWEKIVVNTFKLGEDEAISLEKQLEGRTEFSITVVSDIAGVHGRAKLLMKSFLAPLELEAQRGYTFSIGSMKPVTPIPRGNGRLLDHRLVGTIRVVCKFEDLDLSLFKALSSTLEVLDIERRNRILGALGFLYDGLGATTDVQSYLTINGALDYLTSGVARGSHTEESHEEAVGQFISAGILSDAEAEHYKLSLHKFHHKHYAVMKRNEISHSQLDEIKAFFKKFLMSYMKYEEAITRAEHSSNRL